jgi:hypothetical protein
MNKICGFCNKELCIDKDAYVLKVYSCTHCIPDFNTRFRMAFEKDGRLLSKIIRIDEYYVVIFYDKIETTIYKSILSNINNDMTLIYENSKPAHIFNYILELPYHDPALLKNKLQTIVLFS